MTLGRGQFGFCFALVLAACGPDPEPKGEASGGNGGGAAMGSGGSGGGTGGIGGSGAASGSGAMGGGAGSLGACEAPYDPPAPIAPVSGTITGDGLDGTVCTGGLGAFAQDLDDPNSEEILTTFVLAASGGSTRIVFDAADLGEGNLEGVLAMGRGNPMPGTFTNEGICGNLLLCADTPPVSTTPDDTIACYLTSGESNCNAEGMATGSWSLTLTSITVFSGTSGVDAYYVVHGSLSATLTDALGTASGPITVELEF
jgi:hypothetical protein